jgi:hypothetical protein
MVAGGWQEQEMSRRHRVSTGQTPVQLLEQFIVALLSDDAERVSRAIVPAVEYIAGSYGETPKVTTGRLLGQARRLGNVSGISLKTLLEATDE